MKDRPCLCFSESGFPWIEGIRSGTWLLWVCTGIEEEYVQRSGIELEIEIRNSLTSRMRRVGESLGCFFSYWSVHRVHRTNSLFFGLGKIEVQESHDSGWNR